MTDLASGPVFTDEYWRDPYGVLSRLREAAPVREVELPEGGTTWLVTRYADVRAAFVDPRLAKDWRATLPVDQRAGAPGIPGVAGHMMILQDPPDHHRLRRLVARAFTARRIAELRPRVEQIASALLDGLMTDVPVDLVTTYAVPLPMAVICELLGVPVVDREAFARWSTTLVDDGPMEAKNQAMASLEAYLRELVGALRAAPDDALVSGLIEVAEEGDHLGDDEIIAMAMLLLIAGHETTSNLLTGAVARLTADDVLRERLLASRDALPAAVEELLRFLSIVHSGVLRCATRDTVVGGSGGGGGRAVAAGDLVVLSLPSANRDPQVVADTGPDADTLDVLRTAAPHVAFGHGVHHCLGAPLARMEMQVAFPALLRRFPTLALDVPSDEVEHRSASFVHGLRSLPVTW